MSSGYNQHINWVRFHQFSCQGQMSSEYNFFWNWSYCMLPPSYTNL